MSELSIIEKRLKLSGERAKKEKELMIPYDRDIYNPALALLREECELAGHDAIKGTTSMLICGNCGASFYGQIK